METANPRQTKVKAFRLDEEVLRQLALSAKRHEVSENLLVEKILRRHLSIDLLVGPFVLMSLAKDTVRAIIDMVDSEALSRFARNQGKKDFTLVKRLFESNGKSLTYFDYLTDILSKEAGWFRVEGAFVKPEIITLYHSCGMKWSQFLENYIISAYEVVSREALRIETSSESLTVLFPKSPESRPSPQY